MDLKSTWLPPPPPTYPLLYLTAESIVSVPALSICIILIILRIFENIFISESFIDPQRKYIKPPSALRCNRISRESQGKKLRWPQQCRSLSAHVTFAYFIFFFCLCALIRDFFFVFPVVQDKGNKQNTWTLLCWFTLGPKGEIASEK